MNKVLALNISVLCFRNRRRVLKLIFNLILLFLGVNKIEIRHNNAGHRLVKVLCNTICSKANTGQIDKLVSASGQEQSVVSFLIRFIHSFLTVSSRAIKNRKPNKSKISYF